MANSGALDSETAQSLSAVNGGTAAYCVTNSKYRQSEPYMPDAYKETTCTWYISEQHASAPREHGLGLAGEPQRAGTRVVPHRLGQAAKHRAVGMAELAQHTAVGMAELLQQSGIMACAWMHVLAAGVSRQNSSTCNRMRPSSVWPQGTFVFIASASLPCMHANKHARTHAHTYACTHARTHSCTDGRTHARMHARTRTCSHTGEMG